MQISSAQSEIEGVRLIELDLHRDDRGFFSETFNEQHYDKLGLPTQFAQSNQSFSYQGVLRGMHVQTENPQGKLIRCAFGRVFDAWVDLRADSPTFGKWDACWLDWETPQALWLPPGLAHGFFTASSGAILTYLCSSLYDKASDGGLAWDDPTVGIEWPFPQDFIPIVSKKDALLPNLSAYRSAKA
jgi:dTDP-4-dehydrorhamnose 3,5-epimerase